MITLANTPVLETERLILRAPQADDFAHYAAFMAGARSEFVGGPLNADMAWRSFGHFIGHWVMRGFGFFVMTEKATGRAIGTVGPWCPHGWPEPEIGWTLWDQALEGKGIAREAAEAARAFVYGQLGWQTAISLIEPDNHPSAALARRMGAAPEGQVELRGTLFNIWRHPSADQLADGSPNAYA